MYVILIHAHAHFDDLDFENVGTARPSSVLVSTLLLPYFRDYILKPLLYVRRTPQFLIFLKKKP